MMYASAATVPILSVHKQPPKKDNMHDKPCSDGIAQRGGAL